MTDAKLLTAILTVSTLFSPYCYAAQWFVDGIAYAPNSQQTLYTEHHQVSVDQLGQTLQSKVLYRSPDGQQFADKVIDYRHSQTAPDVLFSDHRNQTQIEVVNKPQSIVITYTTAGKQQRQSVGYKAEDKVVIDAGFNHFVLQHWSALLAGDKIVFAFLAIDRAKLIDFSVEKIAQTADKLELAIKPDSFFIGLLVDPIVLSYSRHSRQLQTYQGLTNLQRAEKGQLKSGNFVARIEYVYQQQH
ncbi:hypothetical protein [Neptunicella sp. SCSIO 80796]|uniref:hypothetical protein n=1 Tax=Neptunicella plasticusilytica TaxID=3117012 RepID=UPI003A4D254B